MGFVTLSLLFLSATSVTIATPAAANDTPASRVVAATIPGGTPIDVHLTGELSSSTAKAGDKFSFSVASDVRCGGWLVIPAGAQGVGEVATVENAGGNGHSGKLALQWDYVYAADGEKVRVTQTNANAEGEQKKGAASTATIASYALLGPVGLFAHNWIHGRDVTVTPAQHFTVFVDNTVRVQASDHRNNTDNFAR